MSFEPALSELSDEALMVRYVTTGDKRAFEHLFHRYASRLHAFFSRQSLAREEAADLVQRTFLHVHRARADYQPERLFRPWLYTIALNVRRELGRKWLRTPQLLSDPQGQPEPSVAPLVKSSSDRAVQRAILQLPESQREVILLHWYEGLTFPEIADMLGASTTAVKVRAHRGYEGLRELLSDLK